MPTTDSASARRATTTTGSSSALDRLRAPQKSELARKRSIRKNSSTVSYHKTRPACSADTKSISPACRVSEFLNESLKVSARKLFCSACREEVSLKRSCVTNHIASTKRKQSKTKLAMKESWEKDISEHNRKKLSIIGTFLEQGSIA